MADAEGGSRPWARVLGIGAVGLVLVAFFIYRGFPYDRVATFVSSELALATGYVVAIGAVEPRLQLAGPAVEATGIRATAPDGKRIALDRALVRPAWSLAWLRGRRAFHTELAGAMGESTGTVMFGGGSSFDGELSDVDLAELPLETWWPGAALKGRADATLDLTLGEAGPEGPVRFEAREGTIELPGLPIAVPYDTLTGEIEFGGDELASLQSLPLEGPVGDAEVSGTIGRATSLDASPLRLEITLTTEPALRAAVEGLGVRLGRDGVGRLRISGTLANPVIR